jgi:hypothetical protein
MLPFVHLDAVWHIGDPKTLGDVPSRRVAPKNWDYEFGLFSVSLQPELWRAHGAGPGGVVYELRANDRSLKFVDADEALASLRGDIEAAALRWDIFDLSSGAGLPTARLYAGLELTEETQLDLAGRSFED